jgi:xylitol oxidase
MSETVLSERLENWSGHHTFSTTRVYRPQSMAQLQEVVSRSRKVKVIGSRHSFNNIADAEEALISLENLDQSLVIDPTAHTVTVNGGITDGKLCQELNTAGYSIHNMASLPHITLAGAISTATHGSGDNNGNLATAVRAIELVKANGDVVVLSREQNKEDFEGAVVGLGAVGVMSKVTLDIAPAFRMRQEIYENLPVTDVEANFDAIFSSAYSVSFFTKWQNGVVNQVWRKEQLTGERVPPLAPTFYGATLATMTLRPSGGPPPANSCTPQMGEVGNWHERLPHFRVENTPSEGNELQSEYLVPRQHALAAMRAYAALEPRFRPFLLVSEVRTVAADNFWLSSSYQQPVVGLHSTWRKDWPSVQRFLPILEEAMKPFQARPHWGKLFTMSPQQVQGLYPRMEDFNDLLHRYDPTGKFRNPFIDHYIFGAS